MRGQATGVDLAVIVGVQRQDRLLIDLDGYHTMLRSRSLTVLLYRGYCDCYRCCCSRFSCCYLRPS